MDHAICAVQSSVATDWLANKGFKGDQWWHGLLVRPAENFFVSSVRFMEYNIDTTSEQHLGAWLAALAKIGYDITNKGINRFDGCMAHACYWKEWWQYWQLNVSESNNRKQRKKASPNFSLVFCILKYSGAALLYLIFDPTVTQYSTLY